MRYRTIAAAALVAALTVAPASAVVTTLSFSGDICGASGDQACSNYSEIGQSYGDSAGANVQYRSFTTGTGTTFEPYLKYWTQYGDLPGIVWGGGGQTGFTSEIVIAAAAGYEVSLTGFDFATYLGRSASVPFSITSLGGTSIYSGTNSTQWPTHNSLAINSAYFADGIRLQWGPDGYDVGLDNISFDVRVAEAAAAVPEPQSWAMMIVGFAWVGGALRRRRAPIALLG